MILYIHEANRFTENVTSHEPYGGRSKQQPLIAPSMKSKLFDEYDTTSDMPFTINKIPQI